MVSRSSFLVASTAVALAAALPAQARRLEDPRVELSTLPRSAPFPGSRTVHIVFPDGTPGADAEVWIVRSAVHLPREISSFDRAGYVATRAIRWTQEGAVAANDALGTVVTERLSRVADPQGRIHVPDGRDHAKLYARLFRGGVEWRGAVERDRPVEGRVDLVLHEVVPVRVVGASGAPASGVTLRRANSFDSAQEVVRTDDAGIARAPIGVTSDDGPLPGSSRLRVDALFDPPVEVELVSGREAVAVLPPYGSIDVLVPDAGPARVGLWCENGQGRVVEPIDGVATFDLVPLEARFVTWIVGPLEEPFDGRLEARSRHAFDGPTRPGERVEFAMPRSSSGVRFHATLVCERGEPLAGRGVRVRLELETELRESWARTDERGRIAFVAHPEHAVTLRGWDAPGQDGRRTLREATVELGTGILIDGAREMGEVLLARVPVRLVGRVVDREGRAIEGASVGFGDERGRVLVADETRADGSFALHGTAGEPGTLYAHAHGFERSRVDLAPGAVDELVIVLTPTASIHTRLRAPRPIRDNAFLRIQDSSGRTTRLHDPEIHPVVTNTGLIGGAAAEGLAPGPATLVIESYTGVELATFEVHLAPAATTWIELPELADDALGFFDLLVLDEQDRPLRGSVAALRSDLPPISVPDFHRGPSRDGVVRRVVAEGSGRLRVPRARRGVVLEVWVKDRLPLSIDGDLERASVLTVRPSLAPEFLLRLPDGFASPADGWSLALERLSGSGPPWDPAVRTTADAVRMRLAPGRFRAVAWAPTTGRPREYASCEIDVVADPSGQGEILLAFEPDRWAALAAARGPDPSR